MVWYVLPLDVGFNVALLESRVRAKWTPEGSYLVALVLLVSAKIRLLSETLAALFAFVRFV